MSPTTDAPDLADRASFGHWTPITLRYSDQDPLGHVNNAAYLVYLGIGMIWPLLRTGPRSPEHMSSTAFQSLNAPVHSKSATGARAFWKGFALQASNPKNIAFFVAILPPIH